MTITPLATYLKMYRKRTGFSQEEVAFLLGSMSGTSVSRHESGARHPALKTVLGYEMILDAPARALYEGISQEVEATVRQRARGLRASLERRPQNVQGHRKIALLKRLVGEEEKKAA